MADTVDIENLINEAQANLGSNKLMIARKKAEEALELSKDKSYSLGQAKSSLVLGRVFRKSKQYNEASEFFLQSINLFNGIPSQKQLKLQALTEMGFLHQEQEFHQTAVEYFKQAYELNKDTKRPKENFAILESMALSHLRMEKYNLAVENYNTLLGFYQKEGDQEGELKLLAQIRDILKLNRQYKDAITYQQKMLKIINRLNDGVKLAEALNELGSLHQLDGDQKTALTYFSQALLMNQNLQDPDQKNKISSQNFEIPS